MTNQKPETFTFTRDELADLLALWDQSLNPDNYVGTEEMMNTDFQDVAYGRVEELGLENEFIKSQYSLGAKNTTEVRDFQISLDKVENWEKEVRQCLAENLDIYDENLEFIKVAESDGELDGCISYHLIFSGDESTLNKIDEWNEAGD